MNNFYLISTLIFIIPSVSAFSIGLSPQSIELIDNADVILINPNSFDVDFKVSNCDYPFIDTMRSGRIKSMKTKVIEVRYDVANNSQIDSCNLEFSFSNNIYSTAIMLPVKLSHKESFPDFSLSEESTKFNWLPIAVASLVLLISIFIIFRFF
ncbi:hypothetical protein H6503_00860 [Candidatus Woesearchaeota archaeon]|nr:hypothetical protein [Candidatus Woesearchaeota archaeon]